MNKIVFAAALCLLLMSSLASAKDDGGIVGSISKLFSSLVDGIMNAVNSVLGGGKGKSTKPADEVVCNPPYMRYGSGCCLDADGSGVCDRDEVASSTSSEPTTTTTKATTTSTKATTTTTVSTTTTTEAVIACARSSDCGEEKIVRICYNNDVYRQRIAPLCTNPATPEAVCINRTSLEGASMMSKPVPTERCSEGCKDGECI